MNSSKMKKERDRFQIVYRPDLKTLRFEEFEGGNILWSQSFTHYSDTEHVLLELDKENFILLEKQYTWRGCFCCNNVRNRKKDVTKDAFVYHISLVNKSVKKYKLPDRRVPNSITRGYINRIRFFMFKDMLFLMMKSPAILENSRTSGFEDNGRSVWFPVDYFFGFVSENNDADDFLWNNDDFFRS